MKLSVKGTHGLARRLIFLLIGLAAFLVVATPSVAGMVTSSSDSGPGTLRQAIIDANGDGVPTLITFDPDIFPATISLKTSLPAAMGEGDIIDTTGLKVVIDGSAVSNPDGGLAIGIQVMADDVEVRGLTIQNFADEGIYVSPSETDHGINITNVTISKNRLLNNLSGIRVSGNCGPHNRIEATLVGNDLLNNLTDGITVDGSLNDCPGNNEVHVIIKGNRAVNNSGYSNEDGHGIRVLGGMGNGSHNQIFVDILNNQTLNNRMEGIAVVGAGPSAASNNYIVTRIIKNVTRNNGTKDYLGGNGIVVRGGSYREIEPAGRENTVLFEVKGNHCTENEDNGIVISGAVSSNSTNNYVHGVVALNLARANGLDGIRMSGGTGTASHLDNIKIENNRLIENQQHGIHAIAGGGRSNFVEKIVLAKNLAARNGQYGIFVNAGLREDNTVSVDRITGNRTVVNAGDGLAIYRVLGDGNTPIAFNRSHLNGEDGIDIDSTGYLLKRNSANKNTVDGINALGNIDGLGNVALGNASCNTPGCF